MDFRIRGGDSWALLTIRSARRAALPRHAERLADCLNAFLSTPRIQNPPRSLAELPKDEKSLLLRHWGETFLNEAFLLGRERDPRVFYHGMLVLGGRLEADGRFEAAAAVYGSLLGEGSPSLSRPGAETAAASPSVPEKIRDRAQQRLAVLRGGGALAPRWFFSLERLGDELLRPAPLIAMVTAGAAYKLTRLGALAGVTARVPWLGGGVLRAVAATPAFFVETLTFVGTERLAATVLEGAQVFNSEGLEAECMAVGAMMLGLRLSGLATRTAVRRLEVEHRFSLWAIPQIGMFNGILLGSSLQPRSPQSSQHFDWPGAVTTLLHFNMAGNLLHRGVGPRFRAWEMEMDAIAKRLEMSMPRFPDLSALAVAGGPWETSAPHLPAESKAELFGMQMSTKGDPPRGEAPKDLRRLYAREFPPPSEQNFSSEIIEHALKTRGNFPHFSDRLLEAYASRPNRGTRQQYFTARAIEHLYLVDPLRSSIGTFWGAQLQFVLNRILSESSPVLRLPAVQTVLDGMENGFGAGDLRRWVQKLAAPELRIAGEPQYSKAFQQRYFQQAASAWQGFRDHDKVMLFNFVEQASLGDPGEVASMIQLFGKARVSGFYSAVDLNAALDSARRHPLGKLVLHRMLRVLSVEDLPEKLRELSSPRPQRSLIDEYLGLRRYEGIRPEAVVERLRGSAHLSFFDDAALTRKAVSVLEDVAEFHENPGLRYRTAGRLSEAVDRFVESRKSLEPEDLLQLLETNSTPQTKAILLGWTQKDFDIEMVSKAKFQTLFNLWGQAAHSNVALFRQGEDGVNGRIYLMEAPPPDLSRPEGTWKARLEVARRMIGLIHEWEHWRHSSGKYEGIEAPSAPISLLDLSRRGRLISEMMALMEEERWRNRNWDTDRWQVSSRLGQGVLEYMRDLAEWSNFGEKP